MTGRQLWIAAIVAAVAMVGYWFLMGVLYRTQWGPVNLLYCVPYIVAPTLGMLLFVVAIRRIKSRK